MFLRMLREAGEHSAEDLLPAVNVPALVIAGERDSFTPPELSEAMATSMPHAKFAMIRGGTHLLPLEERARVKSEIRGLFSRLAGN